MRTLGLLWLVSSLMLAGCVHSREIGYGESQTTPEDVYKVIPGEDVIVVMRDESVVRGRANAISPDTLALYEYDLNSIVHVPVTKLKSIETQGSAAGPFIGLLVGGAAGAFLGYLAGDTQAEKSGGGFMSGMDRTIGATIGGVIGAGFGLYVGSHIDPSNRYVVPDGGMPSPGLWEATPDQYVVLDVKSILKETESSITIPWGAEEVTLPKSEIRITHTKYGIEIRVSRRFWYSRR